MIDRLLGARRRGSARLLTRLLGLACGMIALAVVPAAAQASFSLGLQDPLLGGGPNPSLTDQAFGAAADTRASFDRISVYWRAVAPTATPPAFEPSNPAGPFYHWAATDQAVRLAVQHHLAPILDVLSAPTWAEGPHRPTGKYAYYISPGAWDPSEPDFAKFVHALATRYDGTFPDPLNPGHALPRVRYWEMWNEPNIPGYFAAPHPVDAYRALLNSGYRVVKAVHAGNVVLAAGMAPVAEVPYGTEPLDFDARLLCLKVAGSRFLPNGKCPQKPRFDIFTHHPYAFASSPTKHAYRHTDVLVADMPKLRSLLDTARRLHTISGRPALWATEFAWATNPPNSTIGDKPAIAARYVAYAMYEMWRAGVSLIIWTPVIDRDYAGAAPNNVGTGLLTGAGAPKSVESAFAFPFVASVSHGHGTAWGRVPGGGRARILVQRRSGRRWKTVSRVRAGRDGTFTAHFGGHGNATYRAQVSHGPTSIPYFSARIPPKRLHNVSYG